MDLHLKILIFCTLMYQPIKCHANGKWEPELEHRDVADKLRGEIYKKFSGSYSDTKKAPEKKDGHITVEIGYFPETIRSAKLSRQELYVEGKLIKVWNDSRLGWKPKDYKNITQLTIRKVHKLWTPPVQGFGGKFMIAPSKAFLTSSGQISVLGKANVRLSCPQMSFDNFPSDIHECEMGFWSDSIQLGPKDEIVLVPWRLKGGMEEFLRHSPYMSMETLHWSEVESNEWKIIDSAISTEGQIRDMRIMTTAVKYKIKFTRSVPNFKFLFTIPMLLATVCWFVMFRFQVDDPLRYLFAIISLMGLSQVFRTFFRVLPPVLLTLPKIIKFYGLFLSMLLISVAEMTVLRLILKWKPWNGPPHPIIQTMCRLFGLILCYKKQPNTNEQLIQKVDEPADEMVIVDEKNSFEWEDVIRIIDSIFFAVFLVFYLFGLILWVL